jgi:hypothetical protein
MYTMSSQTASVPQPALGMRMAFTAAAEPALADLPATVVAVWPRFRSGDYLVTLEYPSPIKVGKEVVRHLDALMSELYVLAPAISAPAVAQAHRRAVNS